MAKEYIEREALKEDLKESYNRLRMIYDSLAYGEEKLLRERELCAFIEAILRVKDAPAADVVEVKHGEWISDDGDVLFHCSECEAQISTSWDYESDWGYCPNCGAKMDGERGKNGDKH